MEQDRGKNETPSDEELAPARSTRDTAIAAWRIAAPAVRLGALLLVPVLILGIAAAQLGRDLGPAVPDLVQAAGLADKKELIVGVLGDVPGVSLRDPDTGRFTGFDIDVSYLIAADLGFLRDEVRFAVVESEDRTRMMAHDKEGRFTSVDLVVAGFGITAERESLPGVSFSQPYLATEQTVVTLVGHTDVGTLGDLTNRRVCVVGATESERLADRSGAVVRAAANSLECIAGVLKGHFEAVIGDAAILAGFVARHRNRLMAHDIGLESTTQWGINTGANAALRELVDHFLARSAHDGRDDRWETAFERHFVAEQKYLPTQPVAMDRQPSVMNVDVRD